MDVDESGWVDLRRRLDLSGWSDETVDSLVQHLSAVLVGHFGANIVECHFGKNDPARHHMNEVAGAALAHLIPVIDASRIGDLPDPPPRPSDPRWRTDRRTASWRS